VLTTFGQALPLVRYRTGDRIRLVSKAPCLCWRTHPRIQILGKLNEQELATTR
jgi:phenylacetate-coenzyme A ligase PaaK-like adenylate-forming protein